MSIKEKCGSCGLPWNRHPELSMVCYYRKQAEEKVQKLTDEVESLKNKLVIAEERRGLDLERFAKENGIDLSECKGAGHWIP